LLVAALLEQLAIKQDDISVILILSAETSIQIHVSRRLNIIMHNVQDYSVVYDNNARPIKYVRVGKHYFTKGGPFN